MTARALTRRVAGAIDRVITPPAGLVVLIYHRVGGGSDSAVDLQTADFRAQMSLLAELGTVLSLDDATAALQAGEHPVGVVITFDDGAADFCDQAVPVMVEHGLTSTLYLVTAAPDSGSLPWGPPAASWQSLRDATASGLVSVQSHTHDHRLLHRITAADAAEQLDRSIDAIGRQLGHTPQHFAYPKAVAGNRAARAAVAARFTSAALAGHRVNTGAGHLHRLGRVPVTRADDLAAFRHKVSGGLRAEGIARDVYGRIRHRKATT